MGSLPNTRLATVRDAGDIAQLLDAFNREYDEPSPGVEFLTRRLHELLSSDLAYVVVAGDPIVAFGLVTLRPDVWADSLIATLDELYTVPEWRDNGYGSHILGRVISEAKARGAGELTIGIDAPDIDCPAFLCTARFSHWRCLYRTQGIVKHALSDAPCRCSPALNIGLYRSGCA